MNHPERNEYSCTLCGKALKPSQVWMTPRFPGGAIYYRCEADAGLNARRVAKPRVSAVSND